jgi:hypothetical protein
MFFVCIGSNRTRFWFETISEFEPCLTRAAIHMAGMMTILSMRGPEQFAAEMAGGLF